MKKYRVDPPEVMPKIVVNKIVEEDDMINLAPKQTTTEDLPEPVGSLILNNETIALIDLEIELEDKTLKVTVKGLHIGSVQETPFEPKKKKWNLS